MDLPLNAKEIIGAFAVIWGFLIYIPYFRDMARGQTKPHAFSWAIWGLMGAITFFAGRSDHAGAGSWTIGASFLLYLSIAIFGYFRGEKNITRSDLFSFIAALSTIPLWMITGNPLGSVILVSLIDLLAFYPTFRKSYHKPHEETAFLYGADSLRFFMSLCALEHYSAVTTLAQLTTMIADIAFVAMVLWRRRVISQGNNA